MKFAILLICTLTPVIGKTFSLMHPAYNKTQDTDGLTLNGIVFVSDKEWVIWINHQRITPNKTPEWLKINKVTDTVVQCEYLHQKLWYQVTLEPYDTFTPTTKSSDITDESTHPQE
jgi:hypothetical protein